MGIGDFVFPDTLTNEDKEKIEKARSEMKDRCLAIYHINCEADAQKLYEMEYFEIIEIFKRYNKKTIQDFCKYLSMKKAIIWRDDKLFRLLDEARCGSITDRELCRYFICGIWNL